MLRWFYIGLGCLGAASLLYLETVRQTGREPADLVGGVPSVDLPDLGIESQGEPVLVFHVSDPAAVDRVRAAVARERIVADTPRGFAVREGRIVSAGHDATGALLTIAGWKDRPLEIHHAEPRLPDLGGGPRKQKAPDALAHKSHLTREEAMAVMKQLE